MMRSVIRYGLVCLFGMMMVRGYGQTPRYVPSPPFRGTALPIAPQQKLPWTPPAGFPDPLVAATSTLFDQGLADPRGCAYRQISIGIGNAGDGDSGVIQTHGWVLPQTQDDAKSAQRFAVCWNGLVYPVALVGASADLAADVKSLLEKDAADRAASAKGDPARRFFRVFENATPEITAVATDSVLPIKECLLLRLGEDDLAHRYWDALAEDTTSNLNNIKASLRDPYALLADEWAWAMFDRSLTAHMRGDDHLSLVDAQQLTALQPLIEAEDRKHGYQDYPSGGIHTADQPFLLFLAPLPRLLADEERRVADTTAPPALATIQAMPDQKARIAALIQDLDQVSARQMMQPGGVSPDSDPIVLALVNEGDTAVEPLIHAVADDKRLTRSVGFGRSFFQGRDLVSVSSAAYAALVDILHTYEFGPTPESSDNLADTAAAIQVYWDKYKSQSLTERWYGVLADDAASPAQWLEAAGQIVGPNDEEIRSNEVAYGLRPNGSVLPMHGEALRDGHQPSVSDLMARRVRDLAAVAVTHANSSEQVFDMQNAATMVLDLAAWDMLSARPLLRDQFHAEQQTLSDWEGKVDISWDTTVLPKLTLARMRGGDPDALPDYLAWLQTVDLKYLPPFSLSDIFAPLWESPNNPGVQQTAQALFGASHSSWMPLHQARPGMSDDALDYLLESPLLRVEAFRRMVLAALTDNTNIGTITVGGPEPLNTRYDQDAKWPKTPQEISLRRCDLYAWYLSHLDAMPDFRYGWPIAKKDAAILQSAAQLRRYGSQMGFIPGPTGPDDYDFPYPRARLMFPHLTKPATAQDVAQNQAIFALGPNARVIALPTFPLVARWVTDHRYPREVQTKTPNGKRQTKVIDYNQDGYVWQAEEDRNGTRYYGFVGPHDVVRLAGKDIEFPESDIYTWAELSRGLDCRVQTPDTVTSDVPMPVTVSLHNRSGQSQMVPTDFLQSGPNGPVLRSGITMTLLYSSVDKDAQGVRYSVSNEDWATVPPKTTGSFQPTSAARSLDPTDEFAAFSLNLRDWFDLSRPGTYRLQFYFQQKASGIADGQSREAVFIVKN